MGYLQETKKVKIEAAEAKITRILVPSTGQVPKTPGPTFPIMQLSSMFH